MTLARKRIRSKRTTPTFSNLDFDLIDLVTAPIMPALSNATCTFCGALISARRPERFLKIQHADICISTVSSNEDDCKGIFPHQGINYGNQQGDYEGLVTFNSVSNPIWTDSRRQLVSSSGCRVRI